MKHKVVRRTLKVRHFAIPRRKRRAAKKTHSFSGMLNMLTGASDRLQCARPRRQSA